jgi:hypothetical protein
MPTFQRNILPPSSGLKIETASSSETENPLTSPHEVTTRKANIDILTAMRNLNLVSSSVLWCHAKYLSRSFHCLCNNSTERRIFSKFFTFQDCLYFNVITTGNAVLGKLRDFQLFRCSLSFKKPSKLGIITVYAEGD